MAGSTTVWAGVLAGCGGLPLAAFTPVVAPILGRFSFPCMVTPPVLVEPVSPLGFGLTCPCTVVLVPVPWVVVPVCACPCTAAFVSVDWVVVVAVWAKAGAAAIRSAVRTDIRRIMEGSLFFTASVARSSLVRKHHSEAMAPRESPDPITSRSAGGRGFNSKHQERSRDGHL